MRTEIVDEDPYWHGYDGESDQYNENNTAGRVSIDSLQTKQIRNVLEVASGDPGWLPKTKPNAVIPNKTDSWETAERLKTTGFRGSVPVLTVQPIALGWQFSSCPSSVKCPGYEGKPVEEPRTVCILWQVVEIGFPFCDEQRSKISPAW